MCNRKKLTYKWITRKRLQKLVIRFLWKKDFSDLPINHENLDSVVVGLAPTKFNHENLSHAFNIIKDKNASLIAINKSRYFAAKNGLKLGTGKSFMNIY